VYEYKIFIYIKSNSKMDNPVINIITLGKPEMGVPVLTEASCALVAAVLLVATVLLKFAGW
jgi:hypothetical protein